MIKAYSHFAHERLFRISFVFVLIQNTKMFSTSFAALSRAIGYYKTFYCHFRSRRKSRRGGRWTWRSATVKRLWWGTGILYVEISAAFLLHTRVLAAKHHTLGVNI